jgi:2-oxoglutarate ferredoxin oxidoreductase subunit alpha
MGENTQETIMTSTSNDGRRIAITGDVSIVIAGAAGQGIQAIEYILARVLRAAGYNVFSTSEFMSRIRGGSNSTELRISAKKTAAYVDRIDIFIPLDNAAIDHCEKRIGGRTIILGDKETLPTTHPVIDAPFMKTALGIGGKLFANSVAVGVVCGIFGIDAAIVNRFLANHFAAKGAEVVEKNTAAAHEGFKLGELLVENNVIAIDIQKDDSVGKEYFMTGAEAIALGALSGGCDFVASYPMSPSTNVLQFLAQHKNEFGMVVEQAEDEIAAINMAIGAWYAGARALVTTAGGGFALMGEGVSLAGMLETPVVVHIGQRPGPATGLPTRTEQGDLELALYSGHGEFPRAIFAPGTIEDAFKVMRKAFEISDMFQVPSLVLTDQFFLDSTAASSMLVIPENPVEKHTVTTNEGYCRYRITENGLSPRGIPGVGTGIVCVDSDEHTEAGYITEDLDLRVRMADKRLKKLRLLENETLAPRFIGPDAFKTLVVCWGSNFACVKEALALIGKPGVALLHVTQLYPLHLMVKNRMGRAAKVIAVENNATGQFAKLIARETGLPVHETILKYNGMPFSVEELVTKISASIG